MKTKCKHRNIIGNKTIYQIERPGQMWVEYEQGKTSLQCKDCGGYVDGHVLLHDAESFELHSEFESITHMI